MEPIGSTVTKLNKLIHINNHSEYPNCEIGMYLQLAKSPNILFCPIRSTRWPMMRTEYEIVGGKIN